MIEVAVRMDDGESTVPLANIRIKNYHRGSPDEGNYKVEIMVQHGDRIGLYTKQISGFDREHLNILALIKEALNQLDDEQLGLDSGALTADMARRQHSAMREIQSFFS